MSEEHVPPPSPDIQIATLLRELRGIYEPEGCGIWLYAPHKTWSGLSAVDMIEDGRINEVLQVIDQLASGAYA